MSKELFFDSAWDGVTNLLKKAVPIAANVFIPGSGGLVSSLISEIFDVDTDDPIAVEKALKNATPEQRLSFKEKVMAHEAELIRLATKKEEMEIEFRYKDIDSARNREEEITKITGKRDINLYVLAWVICSGFFASVGILTWRGLPADSSGAALLLLGSLAAGFGQVLQYFFGSSKSSSDKTSLMANMGSKK